MGLFYVKDGELVRLENDNWKERFVEEYKQLVTRMRDLDTYISNVTNEEHKKLLIEQYSAMSLYEQALYDRAKLLNIDLPTWKELGYE
jgi:hypothetical protein